MLRDLGPALNPLRRSSSCRASRRSPCAARHWENATALAAALSQNPHVAWVSYLGLPSHPSHQRALTSLPAGAFGGVLNSGVKGDSAQASKVLALLKLASNLANLGDAKTLVIHPASTTHQQFSEAEQRASEAQPDLIRVRLPLHVSLALSLLPVRCSSPVIVPPPRPLPLLVSRPSSLSSLPLLCLPSCVFWPRRYRSGSRTSATSSRT
ncbi:Cys/Met metabolism PLP-dependent enzyme-domain-containing protein [Mycena rosella]|uniref:Cys/Met metabolism PLP-dependent enzyme-domain-containing protein n=1 Tax=Mycena rosella TaxID=1033263 RepID=A0AAD7CLS1_MYCRO|nr:Cys/Met metabolism PLP-dependent enzyme-domain-containing protein [Mycena rosella]